LLDVERRLQGQLDLIESEQVVSYGAPMVANRLIEP